MDVKKYILISILFAGLTTFSINNANAGGCVEGEPCWKQYNKPVTRAPAVREVVPEAAPEMVKEEPIAIIEDDSFPYIALSTGLNVMHHDCHEARVATGVYADYRPSDDLPLNLRLGVEASNINANQFEFTPSSQFFQDQPDFVFIRIPLSIEYVAPIAEQTDFLIGGGPDIIHTSGNGADGNVGFHLGARFVQSLTDNITASVGAGYLWGETDARGEDLDLDGAFTGASIGYRF